MSELPDAIGVFRPDTARRVLAATQAWEKSPTATTSDEVPTARLPIIFRNASGHEIPPYGIMHANGKFDGTVSHVNVIRPFATTGVTTIPLVNGPVAVPNGEFGTAQNGPIYRVKHDAAVTFQHGDRIGWKANSFLATLGCLFVVIADDDVVEDCVKAMIDQSPIFGTAAATLTSTTAGNVTVATPFAPVSRTHVAKTRGGNIANGASVMLIPSAGEWRALEVCG